MVLLEAMSAGVPVIAFRVGGIPEVVSDDLAWLATAGDPASLARAIDDAVQYPESRMSRAAAAQQAFATRFDERAWVQEMERVYGIARASRERGRSSARLTHPFTVATTSSSANKPAGE